MDEKNNLFAIKKVDISKNDAESRASFINEIHLLEKLRGKGQIIRLVDSEINDTKKVLLMVSCCFGFELVSGEEEEEEEES